MTHQELENYLMSLPGVWRDHPFGKGIAVYKIGHEKTSGSAEKMVALIVEGKEPLRVSLRCDPQLAALLRTRYETVLPADHLNKKYWNTIICGGQLTDDEIKDLARLSYRLVTEQP